MHSEQPVLNTHTHLLTEKQVCNRIAISRVSLWKLRRIGCFPDPVLTPLRCMRWRSSEIESWISSLPSAKPAGAQV